MAESLSLPMRPPRHSLGSALCTLLIAILAALLVWRGLNGLLPHELWWQALWSPDLDSPNQVLLHFSFAPRLLVSLMVGAALG